MEWLLENLNVLATLGSVLTVFIFLRIPIGKVEAKLEKIEEKLHNLDSRISRIEGQLMSPSHWEPRIVPKKDAQE